MAPMSNQETGLFRAVRILFLTVLGLFLFSCFDAAAQWYDDTGRGLVNVVLNVRLSMTKVLKVILLLGSSGALFFTVYSIMDGDQQGVKRFAVWLVGLVLGFVLINVLGNVNTPEDFSNSASAGSFSSIKNTLKSVLSILLMVVSMVTVVQKVFQLINGEKEGGRQIFKWFVVSIVGLVLLRMI